MTKVWNGPTDWDAKLQDEAYKDQWAILEALHQGYYEAMNSPEVRAMYEALGDLSDWQNGPPLPSYKEGWTAAMEKAHSALAAYETGLKEVDDASINVHRNKV